MMYRGADTYRPVNNSRNDSYQRAGARGDSNERDNNWRRDQPPDRRGRRFSDGASRGDRPKSSSPSHSGNRSRLQQVQPSKNVPEAIDIQKNSIEPRAGSFRHSSGRSLSMSFAPHAVSALDGNETQSLRSQQVPQDTPTNLNQINKAADPRLRLTGNRIVTPDEMAASPIEPLAEDVTSEKNVDFGTLLHNFHSSHARYNQAKHTYERYRKDLDKQQKDYSKANQISSGTNVYTEKLREQCHATETALKKQKSHMITLKAQLSLDQQRLTKIHNVHEAIDSELQLLKKSLAEERQTSAQLAASHDNIQQQLKQQTNLVSKLSLEVERLLQSQSQVNVQSQIDALRQLVESNSNRSLLDQSIEFADGSQPVPVKDWLTRTQVLCDDLHAESKDQKLKLARLNDLFASQDALQSLNAAVDEIRQKVEQFQATPHSATEGQVTRAELQSYVKVFNDFHDKTQGRISSLENRTIVTPSDLDKYVTNSAFIQHQNDLTSFRSMLNNSHNSRFSSLEQMVRETANDLRVVSNRNNKLQDDTDALGRQSTTLLAKTNRMETTQQAMQATMSQNPHLEKLRNEVKSFHDLQARSDHAISSLNQRFNNLTTEQLHRQMVGTIEPMLSTMKPQLSDIQNEIEKLRSSQEKLQRQTATTDDKYASVESQVKALNADVENIVETTQASHTRFAKLETMSSDLMERIKISNSTEARVDSLQEEVKRLRQIEEAATENLYETLQKLLKPTEDNAEALKRTLEATTASTKDLFDRGTIEQETKMTTLLDQVKEARDSIDARLVVVENIVKKESKDAVTTSESGKGQDQAKRHTKEPRINSNTPLLSRDIPTASPLARKSPQDKTKSTPKTGIWKLKTTPSQTPSLANHFSSQSKISGFLGFEDDGDTIDATPTVRVNLPKRAIRNETIQIISDSESEQEGAITKLSSNSSSLNDKIDLDKWTVRPEAAARGAGSGDSVKPVPSNKGARSSESGRNMKLSKRKRDSQSNSSSSGLVGSDAGSTGIGTSGRKKKKL